MPHETIKIYFKPLGSVSGIIYHHEALAYTNSAGEQFVATSGLSLTPVSINFHTFRLRTY